MFPVSGKIVCHGCAQRLGNFDWSGMQCSCGRWITPCFQIPKNRVDARGGLALVMAGVDLNDSNSNGPEETGQDEDKNASDDGINDQQPQDAAVLEQQNDGSQERKQHQNDHPEQGVSAAVVSAPVESSEQTVQQQQPLQRLGVVMAPGVVRRPAVRPPKLNR